MSRARLATNGCRQLKWPRLICSTGTSSGEGGTVSKNRATSCSTPYVKLRYFKCPVAQITYTCTTQCTGHNNSSSKSVSASMTVQSSPKSGGGGTGRDCFAACNTSGRQIAQYCRPELRSTVRRHPVRRNSPSWCPAVSLAHVGKYFNAGVTNQRPWHRLHVAHCREAMNDNPSNSLSTCASLARVRTAGGHGPPEMICSSGNVATARLLACPVCGATSLTGRPMLKAASLNSMTFVRSSFCCVFLLVLYCFKTCLPLSLDQYV